MNLSSVVRRPSSVVRCLSTIPGRTNPQDIALNLTLTSRAPYAPPIEFVERKGTGHPDTICDHLAEDCFAERSDVTERLIDEQYELY